MLSFIWHVVCGIGAYCVGVYLNLMTLWIPGPSTLNVQSVKVTDKGLVKENVASHCLLT